MSLQATVVSSASLHRIHHLAGTENFNTWRTQMEDILTDLDLYEYVTGANPCPDEEIEITIKDAKDENGKPLPETTETQQNPEYKTWKKTDRKALSHIRLRVNEHVLTHIQACTTSAEAWDLLASTFQVRGTVGLIDLRRRFFSHRMTDEDDIEEHIQKMRGWYQQINDIAPSSCTEADWITTLIASLPDSWDSFTQSIDFKLSISDTNKLANEVSDLRARILAEAHRRNTRGDIKQVFYSKTRPSHVKFRQTSYNTNANSEEPRKRSTECHNCGRIGHWAAECYRPGGGAYDPDYRRRSDREGRRDRRDKQEEDSDDNEANVAVTYRSSNEQYSF